MLQKYSIKYFTETVRTEKNITHDIKINMKKILEPQIKFTTHVKIF